MQCLDRSQSTEFDGMQAQELRDAGKDPYAYSFDRTHMAAALHEQFASLENGHEAELEVRPWPHRTRLSHAWSAELPGLTLCWHMLEGSQ